jgi:hypothetical protein
MAAYRKSKKKNTRFKLMIIFSSDSSDISKSFSFSSSILTGLSFVGSTSTPHLLVDCADRASTNPLNWAFVEKTQKNYWICPCKTL